MASIQHMMRSVGSEGGKAPGDEVQVEGWIRTVRKQKHVSFVTVNDGTTLHGVQVTLSRDLVTPTLRDQLQTGASITVRGQLVEQPAKEGVEAAHRRFEVEAQEVAVLGQVDGKYPLQKKYHSLGFLRSISHLRARTNTYSAVLRVRSAAFLAFHSFYQRQGFLAVQTPVVTPLDCEGAGELFKLEPARPTDNPDGKGFFGRPCYLGVSGQLYGELCASAVRSVYTFGPTFRAEASDTSHHLAEFWMLEPEMAFCDLDAAMDVCETSIRAVTQEVLDTCPDDIAFLSERAAAAEVANEAASTSGDERASLVERLQRVASTDFARVTYTEALEHLQNSGVAFVHGVPEWGEDLKREHEIFLAEVVCQGPVFVTHYPQSLKPFYMRATEGASDPSRQTVDCMDLLVGGVGELVGGSQREERLPELRRAMDQHKLRKSHYQWYMDLRRYGTTPHAGFGMGFERYLQLLTDMPNVRDLVVAPRALNLAEF